MPKARVFPEPVGARPQTSWPASASTSVAAWIGKAASIPRLCKPRTRSSGTPRSENETVKIKLRLRGASALAKGTTAPLWPPVGPGNRNCCVERSGGRPHVTGLVAAHRQLSPMLTRTYFPRGLEQRSREQPAPPTADAAARMNLPESIVQRSFVELRTVTDRSRFRARGRSGDRYWTTGNDPWGRR